MSRHYKPKEIEEDVVPVEQDVEEVVVEETKPIVGIVSGCKHLNVRTTPIVGDNVIGTIDEGTEVAINLETFESDSWYSVTTGNFIGFCMKQYITIKE